MRRAEDEMLLVYVLRQADRALVLSHRLSEWVAHAPELEEDVAIANIALDLLGQARVLYAYAAELEDEGRGEDDLAYTRSDREFRNVLLVEQVNGDFAQAMVRQLLHDAYAIELWSALRSSADPTLAGLAAKAAKETAYHLRHSATWVVRLGDGTDESHRRTVAALDELWRFTDELFEVDEVERTLVASGVAADPAALRTGWDRRIDAVFGEATLSRPEVEYPARGGRDGDHGEALSYLLGEMRSVRVEHPGATW
ncbi:MAG: 1,2-phenylacetyl-CoA epoxidase subunit PaaC [Actinomycetota bacterium]